MASHLMLESVLDFPMADHSTSLRMKEASRVVAVSGAC